MKASRRAGSDHVPGWAQRIVRLQEKTNRTLDRVAALLDRHAKEAKEDRRQAQEDRKRAQEDRKRADERFEKAIAQAQEDRRQINPTTALIAQSFEVIAERLLEIPRQTRLLEEIAHTLKIMSDGQPNGPRGDGSAPPTPPADD